MFNQTPGLTPGTHPNPGPGESGPPAAGTGTHANPGQGHSSPPAAGTGTPAGPGITPFLSVVRGHPTDAELTALVTVIAARANAAAAGRPAHAPPPRSRWSDKPQQMRASLSPGPDAWRRSALPR